MMKLKKAEKEILALIAGDWPPSESQIAVHLHLGKSQAEAAIKSLREKRMVKLSDEEKSGLALDPEWMKELVYHEY